MLNITKTIGRTPGNHLFSQDLRELAIPVAKQVHPV
jgi:hypothetical protein